MRKTAVLLAVLAASCSSSGPARVELQGVQRVVVFPFENLSGLPNDAGRRMTAVFGSSLYRSAGIEVIEQGEVERFITDERIRGIDGLNVDTLRTLSRRFSAQLVVIGVVSEFDYVQIGEAVPVVGLSVRIVDPRTGRLAWSCSRTREGTDDEGLFGSGKILSLARLSEVVIQDIIGEMSSSSPDISRSLQRPETPAAPVPSGPEPPVAVTVEATPAGTDEDKEDVHRAVKRHWQLIKERGGK
ncbi:MAG: hypothetical protein HYY16_01225 [Planctomycetes bacterium]|nr:hypothetical protein [Planctomycetota bacterium]